MDASTPAFAHTLVALRAAPELMPDRVRLAYSGEGGGGRRAWIKGQFAMGTCDLVDAPCAYITVLRDPVDRLLSHYKYICLGGEEGREGWTPQW